MKGWERLEDYCRRLAQRGHELHIVCGYRPAWVYPAFRASWI